MTEQKPTFWQIVWSTLAAAFGVQSSKAHQRDAGQRSVAPYIVAGITFTALFIATVILIVKLVLKFAGI
ncbi:MAG: DUF2970 domain-containing protein [Cellvibrionaceae bacterium]